ncbi:DUF7529 family protein [Halopiger djelfimassiliensis]|uniref:DUF7529 family protein n=1 Tax=Halopiger djelfimassiliensis TaxID=1293047 RepID=UPI000677891C|nr:hypothetical protein [Halopiger djelfimassiliensis]
MTEIGDEETPDQAVKISKSAVKNAWQQTNDEMELLAETRREDGWETVSIPAVDTATVSRDAGREDWFGIVHVIPGNYADAFTDAFERGTFPQYEVYRNVVDGFAFQVTELLDPEIETAILLAGQYELRYVPGMRSTAHEEDMLYTHVKTLDGTVLGSFRHDEFEPLMPSPDRTPGVDR